MDSQFFVPAPEQIHSAWYRAWGKSIGSAELAEAMFNNNRLRNRVYEQVIHSGELKVDARFSPSEQACLSAYSRDKEQLERICGLVVYGKVLRGNIEKLDFDQLTKQISLDEMKIAVALREYHFDELAYSIDMSRLNELVQRTGVSCLASWKQQLHPQMKLRVDFLGEPGGQQELDEALVNEEQAAAIVAAVSEAISAQTPRIAA